MIETINGDRANIAIQYSSGHMLVGLGLETILVDHPGAHFVHAIYNSKADRVKIGQLFAERMDELGLDLPDISSLPPECNSLDLWFDQLGRLILDSVANSSNREGIWTNLDRPATNRLIRLLRKARDLSFGRDE